MKEVMVWKPVYCRTCGAIRHRGEKVIKVSEGSNPKYYCLKHKPKEF